MCGGVGGGVEREKKDLDKELASLAMAQEISWRQKSRALCLEEGDANTKKFHRVAITSKRRNFIESVEVEGEVYAGEEGVEGATIQFYKRLFKEEAERKKTWGWG